MSRTESISIAVFVSIACPLSTFVLAWWGSTFVTMSERIVTYSALTGLGLGLLLLGVWLRRWIHNFYTVRIILAVSAYLFWSVIALAFFMGLPIGNLALGSLAGLYIGRKAHHQGIATSLFERQAQWVGLFTAAVVGLISTAMGILAIQERETMQVILGLVGLSQLAATETGRVVLVAIAVPALIAIQYWLTRVAASWGYKVGRDNARGAEPSKSTPETTEN
ncbi:MAG: hypothetical protein ABSA97_09115 [Verrucomicrobiia bacterium]